MPGTWQDALYIIMSGAMLWLVQRGFRSLDKRLETLDTGVNGLRQDLAKEREDRITLYGELASKLAAQKAVCNERHKGGVNEK